MKEKKNNEELQSRRDFFKRAAKSALPILGAIALANVPLIGKAREANLQTECGYCTGCVGSCSGTCSNTCVTTCQGQCPNGCYTSCKYTCQVTCGGTCVSQCARTAYYM